MKTGKTLISSVLMAVVFTIGLAFSGIGAFAQAQGGTQGEGVTVTETPETLTLEGVSSNVEDIQAGVVSGGVNETLRIDWGGGNLGGNVGGTPMTPPGAPELPANFLFGTGFLFVGFGLLLYRKLW